MNQLDESAISLWSRCAVFLINLDRSPDRYSWPIRTLHPPKYLTSASPDLMPARKI